MTNKTFRAAILEKQKKNLKIVSLEHPDDLSDGQIYVKILSAAICGAQIGEINGIKGPDKWLPHCMGHEGYGIVAKVYKNCKSFKINDHVILHWRQNDLKNAKPAKYISGSKVINAGNVTTFQEFGIISENRLTKIPKPTNRNIIKLLPLLGCAIPTSWGILNKETRLERKNNILIIGAGGIGITLAIIAKSMGLKNIDLFDKFKKEKLLKSLKLKSQPISKLATKKKQFDYVYETTGNVKNISLGFDSLRKNGTIVLIGQPKISSKLKINDPLRFFNPPNDNLKIISSDGGFFEPHKDMKKIYNLLIKNKNSFNKLVSNQVKLEKINEGINILKKGNALRVAITLT